MGADGNGFLTAVKSRTSVSVSRMAKGSILNGVFRCTYKIIWSYLRLGCSPASNRSRSHNLLYVPICTRPMFPLYSICCGGAPRQNHCHYATKTIWNMKKYFCWGALKMLEHSTCTFPLQTKQVINRKIKQSHGIIVYPFT